MAVAIALGFMPVVGAAQTPTAAERGCKLFSRDVARTVTSDCVSCHGEQSHPVDVDYGASARRMPGGYRSLEEAVKRGAYMPGGQVTCLTCHDARSPWKYRIALPPGTVPQPAVNPRDATTYSAPRMPRKSFARLQPLPAGSAVTPTPLCLTCHAFD